MVNAVDQEVFDERLVANAATIKVLHVSSAFYPATYWGGPIFSLKGLCDALVSKGGIELKVLTTNSAGPSLSDRVDTSRFPEISDGGYEVFYCRRLAARDWSPTQLFRLQPMIRWADVVHLTGTYSILTFPALLLCRLQGKPVVWSPRGAMLATREWKAANKRLMKRWFDSICNLIVSSQSTVLHATSVNEARLSSAAIPRAAVVTIPNGIDIPEGLRSREWTPRGVLRLLFISRLDPKKGLELLLLALNRIGDRQVTLEVCGTGEDLYFDSLKQIVHQLGLTDRVHFLGQVSDGDKTNAFLRADVCVLPSHSENFGMVVAEALAHGVPVITSWMTPWRGVVEHDCGAWIENQTDTLANTILGFRRKNLAAMGARGREWMREEFAWPAIAARMYEVYRNLAAKQLLDKPRRTSVTAGNRL